MEDGLTRNDAPAGLAEPIGLVAVFFAVLFFLTIPPRFVL